MSTTCPRPFSICKNWYFDGIHHRICVYCLPYMYVLYELPTVCLYLLTYISIPMSESHHDLKSLIHQIMNIERYVLCLPKPDLISTV